MSLFGMVIIIVFCSLALISYQLRTRERNVCPSVHKGESNHRPPDLPPLPWATWQGRGGKGGVRPSPHRGGQTMSHVTNFFPLTLGLIFPYYHEPPDQGVGSNHEPPCPCHERPVRKDTPPKNQVGESVWKDQWGRWRTPASQISLCKSEKKSKKCPLLKSHDLCPHTKCYQCPRQQ